MNLYPLLVPAGSDTELQYNNGNLFGGDSALTWDDGAAKALTIGNCAVLGSDSAVFQPNADSTTFVQIKNAAGSVVANVDTTNLGIGINTTNIVDDLTILPSAAGKGFTVMESDGGNIAVEFDGFAGAGSLRLKTGGSTTVQLTGDSYSSFRAGNVGFGEAAPETLIELTHATPYITFHNSNHENTDGGGESRIIGKREDGAGTETAAAQIEMSHDGAGVNDQLGKIEDSVNTGAGLVVARRLDSNGTHSTLFGRIVNATRYTANQLLDAQDHHVFGDTDGGAFTITLPAGVAGTEYRIVNTGSSANNLTITPDGAELLMGANANWTLADGEALLLVYESTEGWW